MHRQASLTKMEIATSNDLRQSVSCVHHHGTWIEFNPAELKFHSGFAALARQIVGDVDSQKEQALLRLYAAVSQDARLMQADARSTQLDGFYKILEVGLPQFIKAVAAVVLRTDKGTALLVSPSPHKPFVLQPNLGAKASFVKKHPIQHWNLSRGRAKQGPQCKWCLDRLWCLLCSALCK